MFERFSREARVAIVLAQEEARTLNHPRIDVEHLLLAVLCGPPLGLADVLTSAGLSASEARTIVEQRHREDAFGEQDAAALRSIGIDLDAVRESLDATFGEDTLARAKPEKRGWFGRPRTMGHIPFTRDAKKTIELTLREAVSRKHGQIGPEHLVLAILRAPNDVVRAVIQPHVEISVLRSRIDELLDAAA